MENVFQTADRDEECVEIFNTPEKTYRSARVYKTNGAANVFQINKRP